MEALMLCLGLKPSMEGADESTELWRHPLLEDFFTIPVEVKLANQQ